MFLSRIELPWEAARNSYDLHKHLWRLFPGEARETRKGADEDRQGFLYRVEQNAGGRAVRVLVQSQRSPVRADGIAIVGTREFNPQPYGGQRLGFLLTANPVKTITDTERGSKPGKISKKCRVPLIREDEQRVWLARKLGSAGSLEAISVLQHPPVYFRKGSRAGKIVTVTFEGVMTVADPECLSAILRNGIGHAKAFGCGLLLVRSV